VRVVVATDDDAAVVAEVLALLRAGGHDVRRLPTEAWGVVALEAARQVSRGLADQAVVLCFTGTGVAMAANKLSGVRAALCVDAATAAGARKWNDANVLALSLRLLTNAVASEILDAWLGTVYAGTEGDSLAAMAEAERDVP